MFNFHQTIPLKEKSQDRILTIMIALMICSILVVECSALFLTNLSACWHNSVIEIATVEAPQGTSKITLNELEKTFKNSTFIDSYKVIDKDNIKKIIAPWINKNLLDDGDIPLPTIFTLSLRSGSSIERDKLKFALKALNKDIKMETHQNWLSEAFKRAKSLKLLAWAVGITLSLTLITSLTILTRTRVLLNMDVLKLLHTSGATDRYITKQFLTYILAIALKGILIGGVLAGILIYSLASSVSSTPKDQAFTFSSLTQGDIIALWLTPIIILALMLITTSQTVMNALKRMI